MQGRAAEFDCWWRGRGDAWNTLQGHGHPSKEEIEGRNYLNFLHCVFTNVSSNYLLEWMHSHIGCICKLDYVNPPQEQEV